VKEILKNLLFFVFSLLFYHYIVVGGGAMEILSSGFRDGGKIPIQYVMPGVGGRINQFLFRGRMFLLKQGLLFFR